MLLVPVAGVVRSPTYRRPRPGPSPSSRAVRLPLDLEDWLVVRRALQPITAKRTRERLAYAFAHGLDPRPFFPRVYDPDPTRAQLAADAYLARRIRGGATLFAYNNDVKALKHLAAWAQLELVLGLRREPETPPRALTHDQVLQLLDLWARNRSTPASRLRRALVTVEAVAGLRASELAKLDVEDLDEAGSRIHVRHPAKGGRIRWLPVPRWIWQPRRPVWAYLRQRRAPPRDPGALWTTANRAGPWRGVRRLNADYVRRIFHQAGQRLGFTVNATLLRHTVATALLRAGGPVNFVQMYLGHASIASTAVYTKFSQEEFEQAYRRWAPPEPYSRRRPR